MDVEAKKTLITRAIEEKKQEVYLKDVAERFWLQRASKSPKDEDMYRTQGATANFEKHNAEAMLEFLIKELTELK